MPEIPENPYQAFSTPTLMRAARGTYAQAIRVQLQAVGADDLPKNGAFLLAGIQQGGSPRRDLPADLGVTKQAVSQAVDALVNRGYVVRGADPDDRRRVPLELTDRGREVLDAVVRAVDHVDEQLHHRVTADGVDTMRAGLAALAEIKADNLDTHVGAVRPPRMLQRFAPVFPVRDLAASLAHYAALGFDTVPYDDGTEYGFADRDGVGLHLTLFPDHDPKRTAGCAYLYVRDADALYDEWTRPGIGGTTRPVVPTPYKLREGAHIDPDGNLIRFGSPIA